MFKGQTDVLSPTGRWAKDSLIEYKVNKGYENEQKPTHFTG